MTVNEALDFVTLKYGTCYYILKSVSKGEKPFPYPFRNSSKEIFRDRYKNYLNKECKKVETTGNRSDNGFITFYVE